jgi:uncharacterized protein with von Willebrand factor type A (vWA) domain
MTSKHNIGGIIHQYQKYDPRTFPSPTQPPPDLVGPAMEHMMMFGSTGRLTDEELARAVRLDPGQFRNLGPSVEMLIAILRERQQKILQKYEIRSVQELARQAYLAAALAVTPPEKFGKRFRKAITEEQIYDLERLWFAIGNDQSKLAKDVLQTTHRLSEKYLVDELASKYDFSGRDGMTVPQAIEIKDELEQLDELIKQLEEARETAQIGIVDMEALESMVEEGQADDLKDLQKAITDYVREMAEQQGLENKDGRFAMTPKAYRIFQGKLLGEIFSNLQASRSGRHACQVTGEGAVELQQTQPYQFGDSITQMDIPQSFLNAMVRQGGPLPGPIPIRLKSDDIEVHQTRNHPQCATVVIMDMSGSMRYDGQYIHVKRMAYAIDGLIRTDYPGDYLGFVEMYSFGKIRTQSEIAELMPKPVTITDPVVQLAYDMSDENISEHQVHPHFTNIQHSLHQARRLLSARDTPNRQIILITDGLPTAHYQKEKLFLLYPPHPLTEAATMREGMLCRQEGITINLFLIPSWSQSEEDVQFAYRLAKSTKGRVFFTAGKDLDRFVVWDYVNQRRSIIS